MKHKNLALFKILLKTYTNHVRDNSWKKVHLIFLKVIKHEKV